MGESSPGIWLQREKFWSVAVGGKLLQSLATGKKFFQSLVTKGKSFPRMGLRGEKFSQSLALGGKVLLESGCKGKFSQSQVVEGKVLFESGCGEKKFSLGISNTRGFKSQLDTWMSKGCSVAVLWKGNVLDAQMSHPSCRWCVVRGRLTA